MWRRSNGRSIRIVRNLALTFISVAVLAATDRQATAQPDGDFYRGKTINMYIGSAAGDAYDIYSRVAARHLSQFIPGNPTVVPSNMQGAGSLKAANYIFKQAAQDGTAIGMVSQSIAFEQMVGNSAVSFDARKFNWIGRLAPVTQFIVVSRRTPVKTVEDATRYEIVLAATSQRAVTGTASPGSMREPDFCMRHLPRKFASLRRWYRWACEDQRTDWLVLTPPMRRGWHCEHPKATLRADAHVRE